MNNDMLPAGMTTTIKTEDIKRNDGDLISRDALKNALNYIYDCAYIDSKSKEGIASDIIDEIDQAPAVEANWRFYYDHGYKQAERDLKRPQGEWIMQQHSLDGCFYTCSNCGRMIRVPLFIDDPEDNETLADYPFCHCGADMRKGDIDG